MIQEFTHGFLTIEINTADGFNSIKKNFVPELQKYISDLNADEDLKVFLFDLKEKFFSKSELCKTIDDTRNLLIEILNKDSNEKIKKIFDFAQDQIHREWLRFMAVAPTCPKEFNFPHFNQWLLDTKHIFQTYNISFSSIDERQIHADVFSAEQNLNSLSLTVDDFFVLFGKSFSDVYDKDLDLSSFDKDFSFQKNISYELAKPLLEIYHSLGDYNLRQLKSKYLSEKKFKELRPHLENAYLADKQVAWSKVFAQSLASSLQITLPKI